MITYFPILNETDSDLAIIIHLNIGRLRLAGHIMRMVGKYAFLGKMWLIEGC